MSSHFKVSRALLFSMLLPMWFATFAAAPPPTNYKVLIGTGGAGNTYDVMSNELMQRCAQGTTFGTTTTGGTIENINGILSNKLDAGWGQEDSLFLKKATNPEVNQLKTLVTLHPEEVHVFARKESGLFGKKSTLGIERQGDPIVLTSVDELSGYSVAAWGGSFDTARLVSSNAGIGWTTVQANDMKDAFAKLDTGQVQAVLAVAGAPSPAFEALPNKYKMLTFKDATVQKLVAIYNGGVVLNYSNIGAEGVKSISTNAILFTREFNDPEMLAALSQFRACFHASVPLLRDTRGSHKKWRQVSVTNKGKWPWYELPAATQPTAPAKKK